MSQAHRLPPVRSTNVSARNRCAFFQRYSMELLPIAILVMDGLVRHKQHQKSQQDGEAEHDCNAFPDINAGELFPLITFDSRFRTQLETQSVFIGNSLRAYAMSLK